jgi:hypothetical protein
VRGQTPKRRLAFGIGVAAAGSVCPSVNVVASILQIPDIIGHPPLHPRNHFGIWIQRTSSQFGTGHMFARLESVASQTRLNLQLGTLLDFQFTRRRCSTNAFARHRHDLRSTGGGIVKGK